MKQSLSDALAAKGYTDLTPVQQEVLKDEYQGADLLVSAQTGSGKTLGFGLSIAPTILGDANTFDRASAPLALIIAPTRELAMQVKRELSWLYAKAGVVMASTVGGMDTRDERRALDRGTHIVVATPGRLRDHIMRGAIDLSAIRAVVLDEADEMLDLGFREDLEFILGECPDDRQTLLFSATVPKSIAKLAESYQRDAIRVVAKSEEGQHADIEYRACDVSDRDAENAIINTLRFYEAPNAIVFANTRAMVNRLTTRLSNRGFSVVALSGELTQGERTNALQAMRDGRARVCVATDVAARGIDLPNLDLVVHAELPSNHETLLHRSGRTGRAGRKGTSVMIVTPKVRKKAQRILGWAKLDATWGQAPSADEVRARDEERMLADDAWLSPIPDSDAATVAKLVETFSPEQIAHAYLQLFHTQHSAPEDLSGPSAPREPKKAFGPSVWFAVDGGRDAGAEPRRLLPMLCKEGGLTKDDIGAIRVMHDKSYVELRKDAVNGFVETIGAEMKVEGAGIEQLAKAPDLPQRSPRDGKSFSDKKPYGGKPRGDRKPYEKRDDQRDDRPQKPRQKSDSAPRVWDDERTPKARKPKPESKGGKPAYKGKDKAPYKPREERSERPDGVVKPYKKKGPTPPEGKPTSKKNKARTGGDKPPFKGGKPGGRPGGKPKGKGAGKPSWASDPSKGGGRKPRGARSKP
ncbi:DEAD/DEAH box helicase [Nereida sp. MMG025]|uniref:DEAD/DEAH box helicase n=1 Tax=Nereida sp. MMG025 TaxID=2909981 RepID=UPI001F018231|nr:DEAD/DEAH box helicase [Nereida sp. MMG025]MCF6445797.1 DEAD/DEAH box helicase [Nereida sp. MMG025]